MGKQEGSQKGEEVGEGRSEVQRAANDTDDMCTGKRVSSRQVVRGIGTIGRN